MSLISSGAEADRVVVGRLAERILTAVRCFARISAAAGDARLAGDAVLVSETSGSTNSPHAVQSVVAISRA